jgi:translation initiation factor IF-2
MSFLLKSFWGVDRRRVANILGPGTISSLKSQKKDVEQMRKDTECGIGFEGWEAFMSGDRVQCFVEERIKRTL